MVSIISFAEYVKQYFQDKYICRGGGVGVTLANNNNNVDANLYIINIGTCVEFCTENSCPVMCAGRKSDLNSTTH